MNIAVFMDEVMPMNGLLMLAPKSHKQGVLAASHDLEQPPPTRCGHSTTRR